MRADRLVSMVRLLRQRGFGRSPDIGREELIKYFTPTSCEHAFLDAPGRGRKRTRDWLNNCARWLRGPRERRRFLAAVGRRSAVQGLERREERRYGPGSRRMAPVRGDGRRADA
ncbi:hypothetical protein DMB42_02980 [Nonomuraea sp. WAC 01424]|nr:hypothetical protein DMB42_02980 [Nonomuraea sp. WAC 01424]